MLQFVGHASRDESTLANMAACGSPHCCSLEEAGQWAASVCCFHHQREKWSIHDSLASIVGTLETIFGFTHHTGNVPILHLCSILTMHLCIYV